MERRNFLFNLAGVGAASLLTPYELLGKTVISAGNYVVEQFQYKGLAHFSYTVMANRRIIVVDPERDPAIYYDYAKKHKASITGVIETHPHADFASSHLEIHKTLGVPIYSSSLTNPGYPGTSFDEGMTIDLSDDIQLRSMYTPGHAPDHIAAVLVEQGKDIAVFSGDSLLIGDVGRPDLRDFSNDVETQRRKLAGMMYDTIHEKFALLADEVIVYPAHGAGSLCSRSTSKATSSTIGYEKKYNDAFKKRTKTEFVELLLRDQPFIPKYFQYDVILNIKGAPELGPSLSKIKYLPKNYSPGAKALIIDSRPSTAFRSSYIPDAINIQNGGAFETWLGSVVAPESRFYLVAGDENELKSVIRKAAAIGYESKIEGAFVYDATDGPGFAAFDKDGFNPADSPYTIVDVRTEKEAEESPVFKNSINIPLQDLGERISELPADKPILVHCASGYRSATGSSIIKKYLPSVQVYDLGAMIKDYKK